jgi:hypothetical protein
MLSFDFSILSFLLFLPWLLLASSNPSSANSFILPNIDPCISICQILDGKNYLQWLSRVVRSRS